jgi:hypothetical protein
MGDIETAERLRKALDDDEHHAYVVLVSAAFGQAADRRFGEQHTPADIIIFVADTRARYPKTAELSARLRPKRRSGRRSVRTTCSTRLTRGLV